MSRKTADLRADASHSVMLLRLLVLIVPVLSAMGATAPNAATRRWWSHVRTLAGDQMQGRDTGSVGHRRAAGYVADRFREAGLRPGWEGRYFQEVPLQAVDVDASSSNVELVLP